jgi:hypothetical protein
MHRPEPTLQALRSLVGQRVRHQNSTWCVIDVLADGPSVVLRDCENHLALQRDQFGEPHRMVPRTLVVAVWDDETQQPTSEFLSLAIDEAP